MWTRAASACLLALAALVAVASFLPGHRLWGVNHLAFYPISVRIAALTLIALAFVPRLSKAAQAAVTSVFTLLRDRKQLRTLVIILLTLGSIALFYAFRSSTLLLGDGEVVSNAFEVTYRGDSTAVVPTLQTIAKDDPIAPGTTALYYLAEVASMRFFHAEPTAGVTFLNCLLGGGFVFFVTAAALGGAIPPALGMWTLIIAFSSGAMLLFCGYVENYTAAFVAGMLYVASSIGVLHGRVRLWVPIVLFIITSLLHVSGLLLGPSLVWLIAWRPLRARKERAAQLLGPLLIVMAAVAAYVASKDARLAGYFLPLTRQDTSYGVLSVAHLVDVANELLLLMPLFPLFIAMTFSAKNPRTTAERSFTTVVLTPLVIYLLFFNPVIGFARDWDLFSVVLWGFLPLCLIVVTQVITSERSVPYNVTIPAATIAFVLTSAWIGVNASPERSMNRFERILSYQEHLRDYAYETLATAYYHHGRLPDAIRAQETATTISENPRRHFTLARYYKEYGDVETSFQVLQYVVEHHPRFRPARQQLVVALFERGRFEEVIEVAGRGVQGDSREPSYYYYIGMSLVRLGRMGEGKAALLVGQQLQPGPPLSDAIAAELRRLESGDATR